jgi:glycosyltransferase involved in cell wall biosynthesis
MILYYNPNVGSGIEYVGDVFKSWIDELSIPYIEVKDQDHPLHLTKNHFSKIKPDVIIINEEFDSICNAASYYKLLNPDTKIVYIHHSWQSIIHLYQNQKYENRHKRSLLELSDHIICVNYPPENTQFPEHLKHKIYKAFMPVDTNEYYPKTPYVERIKSFVYIGNIIKHKMSETFVKEINKSDCDVNIDCYGRIIGDGEYKNLFLSCENITYKGYADQKDIPDILNRYQFYVLAHDGHEPFNISLLQSILCGTIPLIMESKSKEWLHWAKRLYLMDDDLHNFIKFLVTMATQKYVSEMSIISNNIVDIAQSRFNYTKFKENFQRLISNLQ